MNAPIRYFGGKNGMFNEIIAHFPEKGSYETYIEPFGGSYGIGFHMDYIPPCEIYNDLDKNVYSLYKVLNDKELFSQFKEKCDLMYYSSDIRNECKEMLNNKDISILDRAFAFFYVNKTSHNGVGGFSLNTLPRRNMSKSISDMLSTIDRLTEIHQRLSKVIVTNKDGIELIERYNTPNVFIYADPPYTHDTRGGARYHVDMDFETHARFIEACIKSEAKILISGYDNEMYERLTDNGFNRIDFNVNTTSGTHKPKQKTESLWKNY